MLVWNNEFYDYEIVFRIWRYISLYFAIFFNSIYFGGLINLLVLLDTKSEVMIDLEKGSLIIADSDILGKDTAWGVFEIFNAMMTSYMLVTFLPTFLANLVIMVKEMFMKQDAFDSADDYQPGEMMGLNLDLM